MSWLVSEGERGGRGWKLTGGLKVKRRGRRGREKVENGGKGRSGSTTFLKENEDAMMEMQIFALDAMGG